MPWETLFMQYANNKGADPCASAQSDHRIYCSLLRWYNTSTCYSRNFKKLGRFESYLVANPEDRVSHFMDTLTFRMNPVQLWEARRHYARKSAGVVMEGYRVYFLRSFSLMVRFSPKLLNPYKPSVVFIGHRQTVQSQIRRRRTRRLIRVFTVCWQEYLFEIE